MPALITILLLLILVFWVCIFLSLGGLFLFLVKPALFIKKTEEEKAIENTIKACRYKNPIARKQND